MNALAAKIRALIERDGPIGVGEYMRIALTDPEHGYYMRKDPLGAGGDFVTAPEISQMFGELLGLFFVQAWQERGCPPRFHFVELGPGRGTLMADMLRAASLRPNFLAAANVVLVEASPALRAIQKKTLKGARLRWLQDWETLTDAPLFLIANEFLDALPVRQLVRGEVGWHERRITSEGGRLAFTLSEDTLPPETVPVVFRGAPAGSVLEIGEEALACVWQVADMLERCGGVALFVDYGHTQTGLGDSFQAVKAHRYADPLAEPGEADLTFHVDFSALAAAARDRGASVFGPMPQGAFLDRLGIRTRAERLKREAPREASAIDVALARLIGADGMGALFKVMAVADKGVRHLEGFA